MLLRFAAENILSFKNAVEFNTFPSSKSKSHDWHKLTCNHATVLRLSAIYGANGAGKSNLLKCISLLREMVLAEKLGDLRYRDDFYFKLDRQGETRPSELAIEFYADGNNYYYHVVFKGKTIMEESMSLSCKTKDVEIFSRRDNRLNISNEFLKTGGDKSAEAFVDAVTRIMRPDMLVLSFFGHFYPEEIPLVRNAFEWFKSMQVILPAMNTEQLPQMFDTDPGFAELVNDVIPELKTGITSLEIHSDIIAEEDARDNPRLYAVYTSALDNPGKAYAYRLPEGEVANVVSEEGVVRIKKLVAVHVRADGEKVRMEFRQESDGTRRLVEYMPLLYSILKRNGVFLIDEIERSIHPIMIKSIISRISESTEAKGQLIFTTHESSLLDQSVFRPDEIWFAQKDVEQSTQLYPLSDYNIHKTANIENGYLNGRYGGIPFLSNLSDLRW